jgi:hypothetical protein
MEFNCNQGSLAKFEIFNDRDMEVIVDIMQYILDNEIAGNLTSQSDAQISISSIGILEQALPTMEVLE